MEQLDLCARIDPDRSLQVKIDSDRSQFSDRSGSTLENGSRINPERFADRSWSIWIDSHIDPDRTCTQIYFLGSNFFGVSLVLSCCRSVLRYSVSDWAL